MARTRRLSAPSAAEADVVVADVFGNAIKTLSTSTDLRGKDPRVYAKEMFGARLFSNQVDIIKLFWDTSIGQADIIETRQCGKSTGSAIGVLGAAMSNMYPTLENVTQVYWFANKLDQAVGIGGLKCWRLLDNSYQNVKHIWDRDGSSKGHLSFVRNAGLNSRQIGTVDFRTANPAAFSEGPTVSLLVIDEAARLADIVYSEVLLPMGTATNAKIVKIGVPRLKNHFYYSAHDPEWFHLRCDWSQAEIYYEVAPCELLTPDTRELIGRYGVYPLQHMPLAIKRKLFPTNPILHVLPKGRQEEQWLRLHDWRGDMSEDDFATQYQLIWIVDAALFLKLPEQVELFNKGTHPALKEGIPGEAYFYGFDPCGEEAITGFGAERTKKAHASLSVWRRTPDALLEKVYCDERESGTAIEQVEWVQTITHPLKGLFRCTAGAWDNTGLSISATNEAQRRGMPILPVNYGQICPGAGKNFKNAMFDHFQLQVDRERAHYPQPESIEGDDANPVFERHREEWEHVEKKVGAGANADIRAPGDLLDDGPNSDVLATWIADHYQQVKGQLKGGVRATVGMAAQGAMGRR